MVTPVKGIEPHRVGRPGGPQSHDIHMSASPSDDRSVVGYSFDCLIGMPDRAGNALGSDGSLDAATELDVVDRFRSFKLPRVTERQPFLRLLLLPTLADHLPE